MRAIIGRTKTPAFMLSIPLPAQILSVERAIDIRRTISCASSGTPE